MENGKENKKLKYENDVDVNDNDEIYMLGDVKECYEEENESEKESKNSKKFFALIPHTSRNKKSPLILLSGQTDRICTAGSISNRLKTKKRPTTV